MTSPSTQGLNAHCILGRHFLKTASWASVMACSGKDRRYSKVLAADRLPAHSTSWRKSSNCSSQIGESYAYSPREKPEPDSMIAAWNVAGWPLLYLLI